MQSKSANSAMVRQYFLQVEKTLDTYKHHIVADLQNTIDVLRNEQKPKVNKTKGVIYGLRADKTRAVMIKIGKAKSFTKKIVVYETVVWGFSGGFSVFYDHQMVVMTVSLS